MISSFKASYSLDPGIQALSLGNCRVQSEGSEAQKGSGAWGFRWSLKSTSKNPWPTNFCWGLAQVSPPPERLPYSWSV